MTTTRPVPTAGPVGASPRLRRTAAWLVSFAGFPLGGYAAHLLVGPVHSTPSALVGGLVTGAVLGTVQAWALGEHRPAPLVWSATTAAGLAVGLAVGSGVVDHRTDLTSLVVQGLCCGAAVGVAQAAVLRSLVGVVALAWPLLLGPVWGLGWAVTTTVGVDVEEQFTVFGSSGALLVAALTLVLPVVLRRAAARS